MSIKLTTDGTLRHTLVGLKGLNAVALAADGRRALSSSEGGLLTVWDLEKGDKLYALSGHTKPITALALAADGRRAISVAEDGMLKVWDLELGLEERTLATSADLITALAVTPDGRRALAGSDANILTVWDLDGGAAVQSLVPVGEAMLQQAQALDKHNDELIVLTYKELQERVDQYGFEAGLGFSSYDLPRVDHYKRLCAIRFVALSEDGRYAATVSGKSLIKVWDLEQGSEEQAFEVAGVVQAVTIAVDAWRALVVAEELNNHTRGLSVWDVKRRTKLSDLTEVEMCMPIALAANGHRAILLRLGALTIWDLEREQEEFSLPGNEWTKVAVTNDGQLVLLGEYDGTLKLWSVPTVFPHS